MELVRILRVLGYVLLMAVLFVGFNVLNWVLHKWLGVGYLLLAEPNL